MKDECERRSLSASDSKAELQSQLVEAIAANSGWTPEDGSAVWEALDPVTEAARTQRKWGFSNQFVWPELMAPPLGTVRTAQCKSALVGVGNNHVSQRPS